MFKKVSVLIPTRNRIARLRALLASYEETTWTSRSASELVFRVDDDDRESREFLQDQEQQVLTGPRYNGYLSMPLFYNELFAFAGGDVLMCGNDDMLFKTDGWAPLIIDTANKYPDGVFNIGVSTLNEDHYPFSVISRKVAEQMGFLWDPKIFWGDIFLRDVMAFYGRAVLEPAVHIDHDWAGYRPDQVFNEGNAERILPRGHEYWDGVHLPAVHAAIDKINKVYLQPGCGQTPKVLL